MTAQFQWQMKPQREIPITNPGVDLILDSLRFLQFTDKEYLITFSLKILGVTPHCWFWYDYFVVVKMYGQRQHERTELDTVRNCSLKSKHTFSFIKRCYNCCIWIIFPRNGDCIQTGYKSLKLLWSQTIQTFQIWWEFVVCVMT